MLDKVNKEQECEIRSNRERMQALRKANNKLQSSYASDTKGKNE